MTAPHQVWPGRVCLFPWLPQSWQFCPSPSVLPLKGSCPWCPCQTGPLLRRGVWFLDDGELVTVPTKDFSCWWTHWWWAQGYPQWRGSRRFSCWRGSRRCSRWSCSRTRLRCARLWSPGSPGWWPSWCTSCLHYRESVAKCYYVSMKHFMKCMQYVLK